MGDWVELSVIASAVLVMDDEGGIPVCDGNDEYTTGDKEEEVAAIAEELAGADCD